MLVRSAMVLSPFFCRELIFQSVISYRIERERGFSPTLNSTLENQIAAHYEVNDRRLNNGDRIAYAALKITADYLDYDSEQKNDTDPLSIVRTKTVNSTSFAAFYAATAQFLLQKNGLDKRYVCKQYVASRRQNGVNIHDRYLSPYDGNSPFKSTCDIVGIIDLKTGSKRFVDPVLFEKASMAKIRVDEETTP
ncbi:MAG: hypothetical protein U5L45_02935 [Saprospiraceae bacterium]|nr:hypothetical protein [Saprospiraceae bacterium]